MRQTRTVALVGAMLMATTSLFAQDAAVPAKDAAGESQIHASVDVGYRFRSLQGSEDSFRQLFNLSAGPRLLGVDLEGTLKPGSMADRFFVTASGLGGDPFPTLQVSLSKARRYALRVNWRQSRFFDRAPLTPPSIAGFDTQAVTDDHAWTTARRFGTVAWTFDASPRLHLLINYDHVSNAGTLSTTRSLDYLGSSAVWAAFARANAFELFGPTRNRSDRATAGLSYTRDRWTLTYRAGYQLLSDSRTFEPSGTPERSINVSDVVTANESLSMLGSTEDRRLGAPLSELALVTRPASSLEWRSQYLFSRYDGPFSLGATYRGIARSTSGGAPFSAYDVATSARGRASSPGSVLDEAITWRPLNRWAFDAGYRYVHSATTTDASLGSVVALAPGATVPAAENQEVNTSWRQTTHGLSLSATWSPIAALTLRPGVRLSHRDVIASASGVVDPGATAREQSIGPEFLVGYRPTLRFNARGSYQTSFSDSPYTRLSPTERSVGRIIVHLEPVAAFTIDASVNRTDAEQPAAAFISHSRSAAVTLAYALNARFSVNGGFDYQNLFGAGDATFLRGALPIVELPLRDREVDRVWQAGVAVQSNRFGATASAHFGRTTGLDTIVGEPALYGPQTLLYGTGTLFYDVSAASRVSVDLQRTTLTEDILSLNNFRANLLTLRFSHTF